MGKLISYRKPRLRVTPKGVRVTKPSARIGGKVGLNLSSRGISASARSKLGTINTGKLTQGSRNSGCGLLLLLCWAAAGLIVLI